MTPDGRAPPLCNLGTAQNCETCGHTCSAPSATTTVATCTTATSTGTCSFECTGENYDMDGDATNGCEASDLPVQDTIANAVAIQLPATTGGASSCDGNTNPCTVVGVVFSDDRAHDSAPVMRPDGRPDWYTVTATQGGNNQAMTACLGISNYPADNTYQVCISDAGSQTPSTCANVAGGQSQSACVSPTNAANSGTFVVSVTRISGTRTLFGYALYLAH